ncbi:hypothetical protein HU200_024045 [Digitaria exilis]|uniref:Uncharacterized protein n=1 Tax=Digitaria exilis TaxID=1010633 RepID=A0A835C221_9POAL|nr:hypothetical protein HU200_024045 [Digitaria exilis]
MAQPCSEDRKCQFIRGERYILMESSQELKFSVHSMYLHLIDQHIPCRNKFIWKLTIPLKIKIFFCTSKKGDSHKRQSSNLMRFSREKKVL